MPFPHPDIKIGETYNLRIQVVGKSEDFIHARPITPNGEYATTGFLEILHKCAPSFTSLPSEIVNSQSSIVNKYDPTRLFKKGDKVRVVERNGRKFWDYDPKTIYTVVANEYLHDDQNVLHRGCVGINDGKPETGSAWNIPFFHIELVTPVEELEPYKLIDSPNTYNIVRDSAMVMTIHKKSHPNAKAAAEAQCDRLNAEWRKEHANG